MAGTTFESWLGDRPKWLQTAAADLLISQKKPGPADILALAELCTEEEAGSKTATYRTIVPGAFGSHLPAPPLKLQRLDKVFGVNAIHDGAFLEFQGEDLVMIYGDNGTGKTGFSRLLKCMCGARTSSALIANVFIATNPSASADVHLIAGDKPASVSWKESDGALPHLRNIHIFDALTAASYVNQKNESTYEPRKMRFISALVAICDSVSAALNARKASLPSKLPTMPSEYAGTAAGIFFSTVSHLTKQTAVDNACKWTPENVQSKLILEQSLKQIDVDQRIKEIVRATQVLALLEADLHFLSSSLSAEAQAVIFSARDDAVAKRNTATKDAEKVFSGAPLKGIGEESWIALWEQARRFSQEIAYPTLPFPVIEPESKCVLCQQDLSAEAKVRFTMFESFVKDELKVTADLADAKYKGLVSALPPLPTAAKWASDVGHLSVESNDAEALLKAISDRSRFVAGIESTPYPPPSFESLLVAVASKRKGLLEEETKLRETRDPIQHAALALQLKELRATEWASQQRAAIEVEISRRVKINSIDKSLKLATTNALTTKKNELAASELTSGLRSRFIAELDALGGSRIAVTPNAVTEGKGKVSFKLSLVGAKHHAEVHSVLSEGEMRVVALASFLADITGSPSLAPFIFDDPISSLDQDYEERVVARLILLAQTRQVIVFTHRLSLLTLLEDALVKQSLASKASGNSPLKHQLISLRKLGPGAGYVDAHDVRKLAPKKAFERMLSEVIPKLDKAASIGDSQAYDSQLKAACTDVRVLMERTIEKVLLNGIVERFRRSVQTLHIQSLSRIAAEDCAFIDGMMTKYSVPLHSQSDEISSPMPTASELSADLTAIISWIVKFTKG